jgi:hypothetical protein
MRVHVLCIKKYSICDHAQSREREREEEGERDAIADGKERNEKSRWIRFALRRKL